MKSIFFSVLFLTFALTGCGQNVVKGQSIPIEGFRLFSAEDTIGTHFTGDVEMISSDKDATVTSHWKQGKYSIEKSIVGFWEVNTFKPVTPALLDHLKKQDGIETAYNEKRYQMTVYVAKMHEHRAAEIIAFALDSFKE